MNNEEKLIDLLSKAKHAQDELSAYKEKVCWPDTYERILQNSGGEITVAMEQANKVDELLKKVQQAEREYIEFVVSLVRNK